MPEVRDKLFFRESESVDKEETGEGSLVVKAISLIKSGMSM